MLEGWSVGALRSSGLGYCGGDNKGGGAELSRAIESCGEV